MSVGAPVLAGLVRVARARSGGAPALVVVDGPAGSGKTTLAAQLAAELGAQVVHMDDLYAGWDGVDEGVRLLADDVLGPWVTGAPGRYAAYDWHADARGSAVVEVDPARPLVVEGCHSGRPRLDVPRGLLVWVEAPDDVRLERGIERDGEALRERWLEFMAGERTAYAAAGTAERADVVLDGWGGVVVDRTGEVTDEPVRRTGAPPARSWFARDVAVVARDLLGMLVQTDSPQGRVTVRLTEVEAYRGAEDPASHAFRGRSARNEQMFRQAGHLYVYRHLGLHHCVNVVTGAAGDPQAVLLRAGEVVEGADVAWRRREQAGRVHAATQLAQGPARLAVALGLDARANGADVTDPPGRAPLLLGEATAVRVLPNDGSRGVVTTGPRVGVSGEGADPRQFPWRLWISGDPTVSAFRAR